MRPFFVIMCATVFASASAASVTYSDAVFDIFDTSYGHLDITSVVVSHDADFVRFEINTRGNLSAVGWGTYMIAINTDNTPAPLGAPLNGWDRPMQWVDDEGNWVEPEYWIGTWADDMRPGPGGGANGELWQRSGMSWALTAETYPSPGNTSMLFVDDSSHATGTQIILVSRAALGLTTDVSFSFDVMTSGLGPTDPGIDHSSSPVPTTAGWEVFPSIGGSFLVYPIPAPGAAALLAFSGLFAARRCR